EVDLQPMPGTARHCGELLPEIESDVGEGHRLPLEAHRPGVETGEVEEVGRELRQALDLLGHRLEEFAARLLVEVLVAEQLEEAAEREDRRAQLVRRVRDERAAGVVDAGEAEPHAVERGRELPELVAPAVPDGLGEVAAGDAVGGALEPADAAREDRGG